MGAPLRALQGVVVHPEGLQFVSFGEDVQSQSPGEAEPVRQSLEKAEPMRHDAPGDSEDF